jgi:hypothetical protein
MNCGRDDFAVGLAPGGELKDEHQQAVEQQRGQLVPALPGVSRVGNLFQLASKVGSSLRRRRICLLTASSRASCSSAMVAKVEHRLGKEAGEWGTCPLARSFAFSALLLLFLF